MVREQSTLSLILVKSKKSFLYYGSRAKGTERKYSDIDLLLHADGYDYIALRKSDFKKLDIPYKVDFVLDSELNGNYRDEIYSHMIQIKI